ncbi:MAG: hypothetical protein PF961_15750 [Planctomycetota bacterium]|jgi:phosphoribosyl-ATP pyrophosphohydrolase|nr:hypothetical protein [Planctomycetota bacterium]
MATPRRIFHIYERLYQSAAEVRDFQVAKAEKVSGTVNLLLSGDRAKLLERWGEEMSEIGGVLQGTHKDPYILEATQCFYWACLFTVTGGTSWDELAFEGLAQQAAGHASLQEAGMILDQATKLVAAGVDAAKPSKLFLLWWAMDNQYRHSSLFPDRWSVEQIMEADLQEMKTRSYLRPILTEVTD